jgi:hypothetical protein
MESFSDLNVVPASEYCGCILSGDFSVELKNRVAEYIDHYRAFEETGSAAILYIAAWQGEKEKIWYEYAGQKFMSKMGFACLLDFSRSSPKRWKPKTN